MNRFFVQGEDFASGFAHVRDTEDIKHISRVLRLKAGDQLLLSDGEGHEHVCEIVEVGPAEVCAKVLSSRRTEGEPYARVTLYQGLPKAGKLELIIQKCVELGVHAVVPMQTHRSVAKAEDGSFSASKQLRYSKIAQEAAKQCGRGILPQVLPPVQLSKLDLARHSLVLIADEEEQALTLKQALRAAEAQNALDIAILVGPEGGFERAEVERIRDMGGVAFTLGKRILRTETAGIAVLAMLLYELEG